MVETQINILIKKLISIVKDTQMKEEEYKYLASFMGNKNVLIFGTGHDTELWRVANKNGRTVFLEHDEKWIPKDSNDVFKVEYTTDISQASVLLEEYKAKNYSSLKMTIPSELKKIKWDVIFVDSPPGWKEGTHGRMQSIYTAKSLATKNTDIFIHDCDRTVEDVYSTTMFRTLIKQLTKLRHMRK